jgi:hypothetical protein
MVAYRIMKSYVQRVSHHNAIVILGECILQQRNIGKRLDQVCSGGHIKFLMSRSIIKREVRKPKTTRQRNNFMRGFGL